MKLGVISLGGTSGQWILEKAKQYFTIADHISLKEVDVRATNKGLQVFHNSKPLSYDCIYLRGSHKYELLQTTISKALHKKAYTPIHYDAFSTCHNKLLTLLALQKNGIPIPKTYFASNTKAAKKILENVEYPIILKIPKGTQGKGVMFADSRASANSMLDALEIFKQPYIIQEYIETVSTDIRAIVVGEELAAVMKRKALTNELRANIHMGGVGKPFKLDFDDEQIAIKSAKAVGAQICGVDMLKSGKKTLVIEVNTSPGLKGITEATQKDIANKIAKFLHSKTSEFKQEKKKNDYNNIINNLKTDELKEALISLKIKAGIIKLPSIATKVSKFKSDEEVNLTVKKGRIEIKKHDIE